MQRTKSQKSEIVSTDARAWLPVQRESDATVDGTSTFFTGAWLRAELLQEHVAIHLQRTCDFMHEEGAAQISKFLKTGDPKMRVWSRTTTIMEEIDPRSVARRLASGRQSVGYFPIMATNNFSTVQQLEYIWQVLGNIWHTKMYGTGGVRLGVVRVEDCRSRGPSGLWVGLLFDFCDHHLWA